MWFALALVRSMRPKQWTKNLLVFAGYLFTFEMPHPPGTGLRTLAAFGLFCAISGSVYILNDAADRERDRMHPKKCKRPIASGQISVRAAVASAILILLASLWAAYRLDFWFGCVAAGYFLITSAYSASLRHMVIVDLLALAAGFVLRAVAGAVALRTVLPDGSLARVEISPWLLLCTTLLALFLGLAKRRSELLTLEANGANHRKTLDEYSKDMLDQFINITGAAALMAYSLYTFAPFSKTAQQHPYMMVTIPFVIYGIFRYLYLVHTKNAGGSPEQVLIEDRPMVLNILLWAAAVVAILKLT